MSGVSRRGHIVGKPAAWIALVGSTACGVSVGQPIDLAASLRVVLGDPMPSGQRIPTPNGNAYSQTCEKDEVVIGYKGTVDSGDPGTHQLRSFEASCASISLIGVTAPSVVISPTRTLPVVGITPGDVDQVAMCPANEVIVGFGGRSGSDIDQIAIICAPLTVSGTYPSLVPSIGALDPQPPIGNPGGMTFTDIDCPTGEVAVGDEGRAAYTINSFGLLCAAPALVR